MQEQELFEHEEQEEHNREASAQEILQDMQKACASQGNKSLRLSVAAQTWFALLLLIFRC